MEDIAVSRLPRDDAEQAQGRAANNNSVELEPARGEEAVEPLDGLSWLQIVSVYMIPDKVNACREAPPERLNAPIFIGFHREKGCSSPW